ncbi:flagellar basal body rod protein FlgC [Sphingorhabdus arenilitoris]|uniref:Flagellar basal-body rod protein FlgC n=1 Tax=Sphingorhabdus arenilitoris TaxID=1490041 RepID=A0ABV8REE6_9SPHN
MNAMEISLTGMDVEWQRLEVIAQNLANANTVVDRLGDAYQPLRLLSGPAPASFSAALDNAKNPDLRGVSVYSVEPQNLALRRVYEPEHPQADSEGYVNYPGLSHSAEMTLMVKTARSYEANIVAFNTARQMYSKALDIGRRSA